MVKDVEGLMSNAYFGGRAAFLFIFVLLLIPVINWIVGGLIAGTLGLQLLLDRKILRLLTWLAGSTIWSALSFYLLGFPNHSVVAIITMLTFWVWTWFMLKLLTAWGASDLTPQGTVSGRIKD